MEGQNTLYVESTVNGFPCCYRQCQWHGCVAVRSQKFTIFSMKFMVMLTISELLKLIIISSYSDRNVFMMFTRKKTVRHKNITYQVKMNLLFSIFFVSMFVTENKVSKLVSSITDANLMLEICVVPTSINPSVHNVYWSLLKGDKFHISNETKCNLKGRMIFERNVAAYSNLLSYICYFI